jgi:N-acetylneuraminic acid mutarotase
MFQKKNTAILLGLCSALAACDGAPTRELMAPEAPGAGTLDAQSVSLLAPSNTWVAKRPIPSARFGPKAGTLNNIIYVVGGRTPTGVPLSRVDAYNVATNTWSVRQPLPDARFDLNGVSVIGGRLYVTGGSRGNPGSFVSTKTLYVYDPGTNTWVQKANMPQVGGCGAQGVIAGLLYVYIGCGTGQSQLYRYNPATNTWITLAPSRALHQFGVGEVIGGKFYLAGGFRESARLEVYNPATNTWTTRAPMPEPRSHMAGGVISGKLYVAGGLGSGGTTREATLRVYSPGTNTWTTKAPLPTPRHYAAGAAAGGLFFVIGGVENSGVTSKVQAYTP